MKSRWLGACVAGLLLGTALGVGPASCWFSKQDAYRGWTGMQLAATGRFRVEAVNGVWWLVTPAGHPFFSAGVNHASSYGDWAPQLGTYPYRDAVLAIHGSEAAWSDAVIERLDRAGLNTIGAWSQTELFAGRIPYTPILAFASRAPVVPGTNVNPRLQELRDYFDPSFESGAALEAERARACASDAYCIGVFSDNELPWGPGFNQATPFPDAYMKLPPGAPGKLALQAFLSDRYAGDVAAFNAAWNLSLQSFDEIQTRSELTPDYRRDPAAAKQDRFAFRGLVAERYFRVVHDALRAVDPGVLILGCRFYAYSTGADTVAAATPYVDVLSVNPYEWNETWFQAAQASATINGHLPFTEQLGDVDAMYAIAGKPILITEWGYRADDAGLPNSWPPVYPTLADQVERADAYERYMDLVLARPFVVGAHWFEYADNPASGRFDGEDNNWGIVNIADEIYRDLYLRMWSVNAALYERRASLSD